MAEQPEFEIDPSAVSAEQFADLIAYAESDEQIAEGIRLVGTETVLERIFSEMAERFRPDRAAGVEAVVEWVVRDGGDEHVYVTRIADGACVAEKGPAESSRVKLTADRASCAKLVTGKASGPQMFMSGKLGVSGDLWFATRITGFFEMPSGGGED
jgi:putative sterol carrier protein